MGSFLLTLMTIWLTMAAFLVFPLYVAVHTSRKNHRPIAMIIYASYIFVLPAIVSPVIALVAFFAYRIYEPNMEAGPNLRLISGFGTGFCGASNRQDDGSFITTEWLRVFFLPLVPILSYRVTYGGSNSYSGTFTRNAQTITHYSIQERLPLHKGQVIRNYAFIFSLPLFILALIYLPNKETALIMVILLLVLYPICAFFLLRAK